MGWRQGSRLVGGETVELPRLLSLVQAVPVEVRLRVEVVMGGHLLVETKVLHSHRLKHCHQLLKGPNNAALWLPMYNFNLDPKKWEKKQLSRLTPVRGEQPGARRDYWP